MWVKAEVNQTAMHSWNISCLICTSRLFTKSRPLCRLTHRLFTLHYQIVGDFVTFANFITVEKFITLREKDSVQACIAGCTGPVSRKGPRQERCWQTLAVGGGPWVSGLEYSHHQQGQQVPCGDLALALASFFLSLLAFCLAGFSLEAMPAPPWDGRMVQFRLHQFGELCRFSTAKQEQALRLVTFGCRPWFSKVNQREKQAADLSPAVSP